MTDTVQIVIAAAGAVVAAAMHGYLFTRESVLFSRPSTMQMFEVAARDLAAVRLWAFHQGIYNLLLGITSLIGAIALLAGAGLVGATLVVAASMSMIIAAVTLIFADPRRARIPGLIAQAGPPCISLVALMLALP